MNTFTQQAVLVAGREVRTQIRSKSFIVSEVVLLLLVLAGVVLPKLLSGTGEGTPVAVTAQAIEAVGSTQGLDVTQVPDEEAGRAALADGTVDAVILADPTNATGVKILAVRDAPEDVLAALSITPPVELTDPSSTPFLLRFIVALAFGMVFAMAAASYGSTITQSVVTEKETRIVEILLAVVPARAMLTGKIAGNCVLALAQIASIIAVVILGLTLTGQTDLLDMLGTPMIWFAVFFLFGFVLLAAMFAAAGATVSRMEDVGSLMSMLVMLVMAPYMLVVFLGENATAMTVMSYVPFSAPVAMPIRLFFGDAQWFEPVISLVILAVTVVVATLLAARIYRNSLLRTGARVPLREAWKH